MLLRYLPKPVVLAAVLLAATAAASSANELSNPGFEAGPTGGGAQDWFTFGNVFTEAPPAAGIQPLAGDQVAKMFGNFSGGFDVTGMFQEVPALPGSEWEMSSNALHWSGDPLTGSGASTNDNWVVQKIVFKNAGDAEIGAVESVILDGTYSTDTWHAAAAIQGTAPANTVQVEAFILFLQPDGDGGSAQIDDVVFENISEPIPVEPVSWGSVKKLELE